ncbi:hypothetical protein [Subtercola endophyticus]|uniref:hypothetical protein n=1 Tax=Subtercola endophyticus TaxID=2895559 RepID=UPI001E5111F8|nr:hypothetical protein [Subtercola endophyticus]UFS59441.1 hypothetical protein LQ955_01170 [Subtercola endophyticus]
MNINSLLPDAGYRIHAETTVRARPQQVWNELLALTMRDLPCSFALTLLRHAPAVLTRRERLPSRDETFLAATPIPVVFTDAPHLIVSAGVSQPWRLFGGERPPVISGDEFAGWHEPGWVKVAMQFRIEPQGPDSRLMTETRISATDDRSARLFAPYWYTIRAGSVMIRREAIHTVATRAGGCS